MNDFFTYIEKLELVAFFAGYPLVYFFILLLSNTSFIKYSLREGLIKGLSNAYVIVVFLYIGMKLNHTYNEFNGQGISWNYNHLNFYLKTWAFLGVLFLFRPFKSKPVLLLLHSLVFFIIVAIDILLFMNHKIQIEVVHNEMRLYFLSVLLHLTCIFSVIIYYLLLPKLKSKI